MTSSKSVEQRLAAAAVKAGRDRDALQAVRDYAAEKTRVDANTPRLRALRLEKAAADAPKAAELGGQKKVPDYIGRRVRGRSRSERQI